jgi:hypothetical protein
MGADWKLAGNLCPKVLKPVVFLGFTFCFVFLKPLALLNLNEFDLQILI